MADTKNVGEVFDLLIDRNKEARDLLLEVAKKATYAENAIWMIWRHNDPVSAVDLVHMREEKERTGKWPKLPAYKLEKTPEGESPTKIAAALCPGLSSYVYDAVSNAVTKLYLKNRLSYLGFWERLPVSKDLRIRFRERAVQIRRNPENPQWFQIGLGLVSENRKIGVTWCDLRTGGKSEFTKRWLEAVADGEQDYVTSGGVISARRKKGKMRWQITQARPRMVDERQKVEPVEGRSLVCYAPLDQGEFMTCEVAPVRGRPWRMHVESNDLLTVKIAYDKLRRRMGGNYHQSPYSSAHGHGRRRAIRGKMAFSGKYERRVNDWIENRSAAIVGFAVETRCGEIRFEKLTDREPHTLRLGAFPYFKLIERTKQKAADAGISFKVFTDFETVRKQLSGDEEKPSKRKVG